MNNATSEDRWNGFRTSSAADLHPSRPWRMNRIANLLLEIKTEESSGEPSIFKVQLQKGRLRC